MKRLFALCLFLLIFPCIALGESLSLDELNDAPDAQLIEYDSSVLDAPVTGENAAREDFIDRIIELAQTLYTQANGRAQRAPVQRRHLRLQELYRSPFPRDLRRFPHGGVSQRAACHSQ